MYIVHIEWQWYRYIKNFTCHGAHNPLGHKDIGHLRQIHWNSSSPPARLSVIGLLHLLLLGQMLLGLQLTPVDGLLVHAAHTPPPLESKTGAWRWSLLQEALWCGGTGHKPRYSQSLCHPCARKAPPQLEYRIKEQFPALHFPGMMSKGVLFIAYVARSYHDQISEPQHPSTLRDTLGTLNLASHYHLPPISRLHWPWQGPQRFVLLSFFFCKSAPKDFLSKFWKIDSGYSSESQLGVCVCVTLTIEGRLYK